MWALYWYTGWWYGSSNCIFGSRRYLSEFLICLVAQLIFVWFISGCAQFIEWNPLRATAVPLPPNTYFVIANSLSTANKAATADFNQRVVECRIGCKFVDFLIEMNWFWFECLTQFYILKFTIAEYWPKNLTFLGERYAIFPKYKMSCKALWSILLKMLKNICPKKFIRERMLCRS